MQYSTLKAAFGQGFCFTRAADYVIFWVLAVSVYIQLTLSENPFFLTQKTGPRYNARTFIWDSRWQK
jgi:hypothetical protein